MTITASGAFSRPASAPAFQLIDWHARPASRTADRHELARLRPSLRSRYGVAVQPGFVFALRLDYAAAVFVRRGASTEDWWAVRDSNPQHPACKAGALPIELTALVRRSGLLTPSLVGKPAAQIRSTIPGLQLPFPSARRQGRTTRLIVDQFHGESASRRSDRSTDMLLKSAPQVITRTYIPCAVSAQQDVCITEVSHRVSSPSRLGTRTPNIQRPPATLRVAMRAGVKLAL